MARFESVSARAAARIDDTANCRPDPIMINSALQQTASPPSASRGILEITGLRIKYGDQEILSIPQLTFPPNKITALIGPTASGKSSLLRQIAGLNHLIPTCQASGQLRLDGKEIPLDSGEGRRDIALLPQKAQLYSGKVSDNLGTSLSNLELAQWLDVLGLEDEIANDFDRNIEMLGLGHHRAILLLRLLLQRPSVLLLDEPLAGISPSEESWMLRTIHRLSSRLTVIFIAHNKFHAHKASDYVAVINHGTVTELTPTSVFFRQPASAPDTTWLNARKNWSIPHWDSNTQDNISSTISFTPPQNTGSEK
ncbi:MAG: ATP-binding cassette domain-containing protein [Xanthomonadaceae bacterium]|nr:ATP-binding cassette domain-containing protein [Xanthomonadaceae bacterium]